MTCSDWTQTNIIGKRFITDYWIELLRTVLQVNFLVGEVRMDGTFALQRECFCPLSAHS
ncbi:hypothetical protein THOM_3086 [Trachipleistophora hominis]|uniref:Uncharacterized protein n=1 Tax=Trachipleistophora hominis TaxID=72359 RepID=L7JR93_TRAHO|nr:hypothetical protein THOM_3086 [Trachipleistophora hominis]